MRHCKLAVSRDRRASTAASISSIHTVQPVSPLLLLPCDYGRFLPIIAGFELRAAGETDGV